MMSEHHKPSDPKSKQSPVDQIEQLAVESESVALLRLIDEVRVGEDIRLDAYNRTYHRHNR